MRPNGFVFTATDRKAARCMDVAHPLFVVWRTANKQTNKPVAFCMLCTGMPMPNLEPGAAYLCVEVIDPDVKDRLAR